MVVELNMDSIVETFFRIPLRHIIRFYEEYLLSLSAKSTLKIINLGRFFFRFDFLIIKERRQKM